MLCEPFRIEGKLALKRHSLFVHIAETTMEERRQRQKVTSALSLQSMECGHIFAKDAVAAPFQVRKHFAGNSASNVIGPVCLTAEDAGAWIRTVKDKRLIYGKDNRVAPGGRTPGIDAAQAKELVRKNDDLEPVFYFTFPWQFHEDVCAGTGARTVTALTLGDGAAALAAMFLGVPFVGVALTEDHAVGVRKHLANTVFRGFSTEGSPFYDARICHELAEAGLSKSEQTLRDDVAAARAAKAKAEAKAKAKAEAKAKAKAEAKKRALPAGEADSSGGGGAPQAKKKAAKGAESVAAKMKAALAALGGSGEGASADNDEVGDECEEGDDEEMDA